MSQTASAPLTHRRARRLSTRAGIVAATGLAGAVTAAILVSGAAGASAAGEPRPPSSIVETGSHTSDETGSAPASAVAEGSGASDATDSFLPGEDTRTIDVLPGEDTPSADAGR